MARTGYTLPVFAVAAAKAALIALSDRSRQPSTVRLDLLPGEDNITIDQCAPLNDSSALAIAHSDPGDNLDITRHTPIWAYVRLVKRQDSAMVLEAGEGLGRSASGEPAIYAYARQLFDTNVSPLIPPEQTAIIRVILPEGRQLAQRTSNAAFGIVEGLALLGTSGLSKPLTADETLTQFRQELRQKARHQSHLVFCIGSNGRQVATRLAIADESIVQTANWIGAMLVEAGTLGVQSVLLIGYHGKLVKLAGGIFNTSSHWADAKLELLAAAVIRAGGSAQIATQILAAPTAEAARLCLAEAGWADQLYEDLCQTIGQRAQAYVKKYASTPDNDAVMTVGTILFDRNGTIVGSDNTAKTLLTRLARGD